MYRLKKYMKKKLLLLAFIASSACVLAQQPENRDKDGKILRGPYETDRFFDNWFIGVAGGININEGASDNSASLSNRLAPALDISIGKWVTPYAGVRFQFAGLKAKGLTVEGGSYAKEPLEGLYKKDFTAVNMHADFLWNLTNGIFGYREKRVYNLIPYIGMGLASSSGNGTHNNEFAVSLGLLNNFRLTDRLDLSLELRQMLVKDPFDGTLSENDIEGMSSITLGISYKLGKTGFKRVQKAIPADYSSYNDRINELRAQNKTLDTQAAQLAQQLEMSKKQLADEIAKGKTAVPVTAQGAGAPVALFFNLGKATLDAKELVNLDFYVENAIKKAGKDSKFVLVGSADSATGSREVNLRLTEKRLDYVYNLLVNKYGLPVERFTKKVEGDANNRFSDPALNRSVIVQPAK